MGETPSVEYTFVTDVAISSLPASPSTVPSGAVAFALVPLMPFVTAASEPDTALPMVASLPTSVLLVPPRGLKPSAVPSPSPLLMPPLDPAEAEATSDQLPIRARLLLLLPLG